MLDKPIDRSSHDEPTPRGGGLSIVLTFMAVLVYLRATAHLPDNVFYALLVAGSLVAGIGLLDDHRHMSRLYRVFVHAGAAAFFLYLLGGLPPLQFGAHSIDLGMAGNLFAVVFLVWLTNLFNFMDGIDGVAAAETTFIAAGAIAIGGAESGGYLLLLEIALLASCIGFLVWNWPPAKIFMGDVGSGFLGLILGMLAIVSAGLNVMPLWTWLILAGVFIVDATITMIRRMLGGSEWLSGHRSHGYQRAARRYQSHKRVTVAVCAMNVGWLLPLAWYSALRPEFGGWLMLLAWAPLIAIAVSLGAGLPDD